MYTDVVLSVCITVVLWPWAEHLTSQPKREMGALSSVSAFNHERMPMYIYSDSIPSKQNNNV